MLNSAQNILYHSSARSLVFWVSISAFETSSTC